MPPSPKGLGFFWQSTPPHFGDAMLDVFMTVMHDVTVELIVCTILYFVVGSDRH